MSDNPMLGTRIHDLERRIAKLEAQCSHQTASEPAETNPTWPMPPRPEKSAAREPGQRGGDGSGAGSGGTGGSISAEGSTSAPVSGMTSAQIADASESPADNPVGVPELKAVINNSDRMLVDINGLSHYEVFCSDFFARNVSEADDAAFIINTAFDKLRKHHERVVSSLRERCERAERERDENHRVVQALLRERDAAEKGTPP